MHVSILRHNRIDWVVNFYYTFNSSLISNVQKDLSPTSFTKNSFLVLGGDKSQNELSFPGDIGPLIFIEYVNMIEDQRIFMNIF
jgi:hypothetical protein